MAQRHIKVKGIRREEIDSEAYALALWLAAKRQVAEKREREAREKAHRRGDAGAR